MTPRIISPAVCCAVFVSLSATFLSNGAGAADTEIDRLREALRSATVQTRQLEDQRTALQAKVAEADREKAAAKAQVDAAKAEVRDVKKQHREAVEEFNKRLAERDETLEKWKAAYEEAATVARTKDAERAKFEGQANAYKASVKSCVAKNEKMFKAGNELLHDHKAITIGDTIVAQEPVLGLRRVEIQNGIQTTRDKFLDQRETMTRKISICAKASTALAAMMIPLLSLPVGALAQTPTPPRAAQAPVRPKPVPQAAAPQAASVAPSATQGMTAGKPAPGDDVVARVGNANVSADDIRAYVAALGPREQAALAQDPALLSQAVRLLLANRLVLQDVFAKKWDQQPGVTAQLDRVRESALVELYLQSVSTPPAGFPSDEELQKVYEANRAALLMPRQFQLAQIFVAAPKEADNAADDKAKKSLDEIVRKLKTPGADFAAIANDNDARNGGDLGWLAEPQIRPEIRTQVMGLAKNAVSEPIRLDDGWHILKLIDTKAAYTRTLPEVREQLVQQLRAERAKQLRQAYIAELLRQHPPVLNELALSNLFGARSSTAR